MKHKDWTSFQSHSSVDSQTDQWDALMHSLKFLNRPLFGLAMLILLGGVLGALIFSQVDQAANSRYMVVHTYEVLAQIDGITQNVAEVESGVRGYVVTQIPDYLIPLHNARKNDATRDGTIFSQLDALRDMTRDNSEQQKNITLLEQLILQKLDYMTKIMNFAQDKSIAEIREYAKDQKGRLLMDRIRGHVEDMRILEKNLLRLRMESENNSSRRMIYTTLGLLLTLMIVISSALLAIRVEFARRKSAERKLEQNVRFQNTILQSSLYTIIVCHPDGRVRFFNPAAEKLLGYKSEEVVDKVTAAYFHDPEEMRLQQIDLEQEFNIRLERQHDVFSKRPTSLGSEIREWTYIRKDGKHVPVLLSVTTLYDDDGDISGYVGIAQDISERKHVDRMKDEFISTVSHELRTPLTSIRGSLGLIMNHMQADLSEKTASLVRIAHKNTERLTSLINDILDIEKFSSGNLLINKRDIPVQDALQHSMEDMKGFADTAAVNLKIDDRTDNSVLYADPDRLQQVLDNLVSNAIKFSQTGGEVILSAHKVAKGLCLVVTDHGTGIPEEFKAKIFQKFAQADGSASRQKGGTGLGLNICKSLVEAMGGTIGFDSEPGKTEFYVILPEWHASNTVFKDNIPGQPDAQQKILICEDDPDVSLLLQMILEKENFSCQIAYSAAEAKKLLETHEFTAITLDLNLPDQDGLSLLHELRTRPEYMNLPVIIISAVAEEKKRALNGDMLGILDWLAKPIDTERLKQLLHNLPMENTRRMNILHIEDDIDFIEMLNISLQDIATITSATNLSEAKNKLALNPYDLVIVDIGLPDGSGLDLLHELNQRAIPVIILSVQETPEDAKKLVSDSMIKSVISEEKIIKTIRSLMTQGAINAKTDQGSLH